MNPRSASGCTASCSATPTYTRDNRPVEYARGVHVASRFEWTYIFSLPD